MPERVLMRLPQGVVLVDSELRIGHANPAAERLLGVGSPGDPLPDPWADFSLRDLAARLFGPDPPTSGTLVETDHHFFWVEGVPANAAETAILIVDDVTERERARQSEREFVENAAHELRTPLAAIVSVMDVLEGGAKDIPETRDRFLKHIRVHSERLSRLATAVLALGPPSGADRSARGPRSPASGDRECVRELGQAHADGRDRPRGPRERHDDPDRDPRHRPGNERGGAGAGAPPLLPFCGRHRRLRPGPRYRRRSRSRARWHDRARVRAWCRNASFRRGAEREALRLMPERILMVGEEPGI